MDNGISAFEEALYIKKKGMELIITDHHQPSEKPLAAVEHEFAAQIEGEAAEIEYL